MTNLELVSQLRLAAEIVEGLKPWQFQLKGEEWKDAFPAHSILAALQMNTPIRIKPTPTLIPLETSDTPPGSVFKKIYDSAIYTACCLGDGKVYLTDTICFSKNYQQLMSDWLINRSIPLLGKWDPTAWEPCSKPSQNPG